MVNPFRDEIADSFADVFARHKTWRALCRSGKSFGKCVTYEPRDADASSEGPVFERRQWNVQCPPEHDQK